MSDKEFDFSDASNDKLALATKSILFVVCKSGTYKESGGKDGATKYKLYNEKKLAEMGQDAGHQSPCQCEVCTKTSNSRAQMLLKAHPDL
jgi:hypothetical protein